MSSLIQESVFGQLARLVTNNQIFLYQEEKPGFELPWKVAQNEQNLDAITNSNRNIAKETHDADPIDKGDGENGTDLERKLSNVLIPAKTPEGILLVNWYSADDPENPLNWPTWKKTYVTFLISIFTFAVYTGSAIYASSEPQVMQVFNVSQSKASLGLSMYVLGYGIGPMLFSPLSEVPAFGRNIPYMSSLGLFVILCIPTALVDNYAGLLVLRFITGFLGSPVLATGGATMQDMFEQLYLPFAIVAWTASAFCGPALGPTLSGFAVTALNWRWSLWEILMMSGPTFGLLFFTLPETSAANILRRRAIRLRKLTGDANVKSQSEIDQGNMTFSTVISTQLIKPLEISIKDPAVLFVHLYSSLIYGVYYSFFESYPLVFVEIYGFNTGELGLTFFSIIIGCLISVIMFCSMYYFYVIPNTKKNGPGPQEDILAPALVMVFLLPTAMFWFAWTSKKSIHWIVPLIGNTLFPLGAFALLQSIFGYLPMSYPRYAASLFAANDLFRSALAAGAIIFAHPLYVNLGIGRGVSVLAGIMCLGIFGIWILYFFGAKLRARSKFAS